MKNILLLVVLFLVVRSAGAQEIQRSTEIEKAMGLAKNPAEGAGGAPITRGATRGATRGVAREKAPQPERVIMRSAVASGSSLETLKTRGVKVVAASEGESRVTVPVLEDAKASFENIRFDRDSTRLADTASQAQIQEIAKVMRDHPEQRFVVEGHTCDLGSAPHNERLSVARADAVMKILRDAGVTPAQMVALGFGESDPAAHVPPNAPANDPAAEAQRQQNRRVVIRLQSAAP